MPDPKPPEPCWALLTNAPGPSWKPGGDKPPIVLEDRKPGRARPDLRGRRKNVSTGDGS
jgi:hypothetical protein